MQRCESFELQVAPHPTDLTSRFDYFGNKQHIFTLKEPHLVLDVTSRSLVVREEQVLPMAGLTPSLRQVPALVDTAVAEEDFTLEQFLHPSPLVPLLPEARATFLDELRRRSAGPGNLRHGLDSRRRRALQRGLQVRPGCHAHIDAACRGAHRTARCLPGFRAPLHQLPAPAPPARRLCERVPLLTRPPKGQPRLVGADASHAWVSAFIPGTGWVDYDPTNACFVGTSHIVIARGRDFFDVSPVKGLFSGGGRQKLETGVTVEEAG